MRRPRLAGAVLAGLVAVGAAGLLTVGESRLSVALAGVAAVLAALASVRIGDDPVSVGGAAVRYAVPGDGLAAALRDVSSVDRARGETGNRERLRERALTAISAIGGDDEDAVARFRESGLLPPRGIGDRVRELLTGRTAFERLAAGAVDAAHRRVHGAPSERGRSSILGRGAGDGVGEAADPSVDAAPEEGSRRTGRWRPLGALALGAGGLGAATGSRAPLLVAGVCVAFVAFGRLGSRTAPALTATRDLSTTDLAPGETVTVTLVVRNDSDRLLSSVHVRDPVPPGLDPVDGAPERLTTLRAGASVRLQYEATVARGRHAFDAPVVTVGDLPGARKWVRRPTAGGSVTCVPALTDPVPVGAPATDALHPGPTRTPTAGAGVELHSVREYHRGDPLSRIDWKGLARSGDLRTVAFHRERALEVVLVVDARRVAHCAPDPSGPPSVERSVAAARRLAASLLDEGHRVGLAALSPRDCWCPPGAGPDQRTELRRRLALDPALSWQPPAEDGHRRLRDRLTGADLVVLCSPLVDDGAAAFARETAALGPAVHVLAPDKTAADTTGRRLARLERDARIDRLRRAGVAVTDWSRDEPLGTALARLAAEGGP